jgi:sugar phosphate isomerase/epimerase
MKKSFPLSFQLYSAREFPPLSEQFRILAELGYENVEPFFGLFADPKEFRRQIDHFGLTALTGHFDLSPLEDDLDRQIDVAQTIGIKTIIAPWIGPEDRPGNAAGWKRLGERLERLRGRLSAKNLNFAWHTHDFEFQALADGSYPIDHILRGNGVGLELDVAWVIRAGGDPATWLEKYRDRLAAVHVKDIAASGENLDQDGWADLGHGVVPWGKLWPLVVASAAPVAVLEHDRPVDWQRFARNSATAFRALAEGKA